jgi:hypothetical protein
VRGLIQLNPIEFERAEHVLAELQAWLPLLILPGPDAPRQTTLSPVEEAALVEAAKRHHKSHGEFHSFLAPLRTISAHDKRQLHQVILNVIRRERGREARVCSPDELAKLYPE